EGGEQGNSGGEGASRLSHFGGPPIMVAHHYFQDRACHDSADRERRARAFEVAWQQGQRPAIEDYLPTGHGRRAVLLELVHTDLEYRLAAGEPARVEGYLERYPELAGDPPGLLRPIAARDD